MIWYSYNIDWEYIHSSLSPTRRELYSYTIMTTTVAVAGGTKGLGLTIAEALVVHGKHNVVIFGRKVSVTSSTEPEESPR